MRQNPKVVALQNAYMAVLFDQGDKLSKEFGSNMNENPNYGQEAIDFYCIF